MLLALLHISRRKRITLIIGDYFDTDFLILIRSMKTINSGILERHSSRFNGRIVVRKTTSPGLASYSILSCCFVFLKTIDT